jgi:hypothetical protein
MHLKHFLSTLALASFALPAVQAQSLDNVFRAFSKCDASFFKAMKDEAQTVQALAPTESKGDAMWFKVPDRTDDKTGTVALTGRPTIAGMPVVSYEDSVIDIGSLGLYYTWGFKVRSDMASTVNALKPMIFASERLLKDDLVYARTELKIGALNWLPIKTTGGTVPKEGTVERAFLIEEDEKDKNLSLVTCTIQGSVEVAHLKELRPDIDVKDYPVKPQVIDFDALVPEPKLILELQEALKKQPLFFPKYKKVTISYKTHQDNDPTIKVNNHLGNGLLAVEENYGSFTMKRLRIGDDVQVKYASFDRKNVMMGAGFAKNGNIKYANTLIKGQIAYQSETTRMDIFPKIASTPVINKTVCTTGDTLAASNIFKSLTGNAILLSCDPESEYPSTLALIENLGLTLWYEPENSKNKLKPVYTSITIER